MNSLLFATGNKEKYAIAKSICDKEGITLKMFDIDTPEIQSENPKEVLLHKLDAKFEQADGQPVLVSDDSWEIPALNGFPGPYMKSMDHWLSAQNFIDLTKDLSDKTIRLHMFLGYKDTFMNRVFENILNGQLITEVRGEYGKPAQKIIVLDKDEPLTISQVYDKNLQHKQDRFDDPNEVWRQFVKWYLGGGD